jgi:hypothetical protein
MLEFGGRRVELRLEARGPSPLAMEREAEDGQKYQHRGHEGGLRHG